jgi:VanZ family protein
MDRYDDRRAGAAPLTVPAGGAAPPRRLPVWLHALALLALLGVWTWKLLEPAPVPEDLARRLQPESKFVLAKCLHCGGYATLTLLAVTLPVSRRWRWAFVALLALHGVGTEIGQTFVPNRTGTRRDVLIDWGGIALGVLALWAWSKWASRGAPAREWGRRAGAG